MNYVTSLLLYDNIFNLKSLNNKFINFYSYLVFNFIFLSNTKFWLKFELFATNLKYIC